MMGKSKCSFPIPHRPWSANCACRIPWCLHTVSYLPKLGAAESELWGMVLLGIGCIGEVMVRRCNLGYVFLVEMDRFGF